MDFPAEARGFRPGENASPLVRGEKPVVDEDIAERRETRTHDGIDHVPCDHLDVCVGATLESGRNRVRSQEGPNDIDARRLPALPRAPEDLLPILGPQS